MHVYLTLISSMFMHGSIMHLALNTGPLIILGGLVLLHGKWMFFETTAIIVLVGGFAVWIIGRPSIHVGASGLIFGYFGFLVSRGIIKKSIGSMAVSFITVAAYGGMIWGLIPTLSHVSWEGHLCGFLSGILAAKLE